MNSIRCASTARTTYPAAENLARLQGMDPQGGHSIMLTSCAARWIETHSGFTHRTFFDFNEIPGLIHPLKLHTLPCEMFCMVLITLVQKQILGQPPWIRTIYCDDIQHATLRLPIPSSTDPHSVRSTVSRACRRAIFI